MIFLYFQHVFHVVCPGVDNIIGIIVSTDNRAINKTPQVDGWLQCFLCGRLRDEGRHHLRTDRPTSNLDLLNRGILCPRSLVTLDIVTEMNQTLYDIWPVIGRDSDLDQSYAADLQYVQSGLIAYTRFLVCQLFLFIYSKKKE